MAPSPFACLGRAQEWRWSRSLWLFPVKMGCSTAISRSVIVPGIWSTYFQIGIRVYICIHSHITTSKADSMKKHVHANKTQLKSRLCVNTACLGAKTSSPRELRSLRLSGVWARFDHRGWIVPHIPAKGFVGSED